jgi:hypothetical protein
MAPGRILFLCVFAVATGPLLAEASDEPSTSRQSLDEAWWTGPLLAASPAILPQGHFLVEPYVFGSLVDGQYDSTGARHSAARQNDYGSLTYLEYGLTDSTTIGVIPRFAFNDPSQGQSGSGLGVGDLTVQAAYGLSRFHDEGGPPTMSVVIGETLPTGRYDRLGTRLSDGVGAGAYATILSLYSQYYLWMPNGRILRTRLDVSESWSRDASIEDTSVYGTPQGFRGHASPGNSFNIDSAWEYSVTQHWVAALDVFYVDSGSTRVTGDYPPPRNGGSIPVSVQSESGSSKSFGLAPAVEYNWTSAVGVIIGAKIVTGGRNTSAAIIPVTAINLVF